MADPQSTRRRQLWFMVGAGAVGLMVALGLLALPTGRDDVKPARGSAASALTRLDANHGRIYVGSIGDATDPLKLRRALRAEFRSDAERPDRHGAVAARRCAAQLRGTSGSRRGRVVLLADATLAGAPAVVIGITDHGRVVAFVADADTCSVRMAQSL